MTSNVEASAGDQQPAADDHMIQPRSDSLASLLGTVKSLESQHIELLREKIDHLEKQLNESRKSLEDRGSVEKRADDASGSDNKDGKATKENPEAGDRVEASNTAENEKATSTQRVRYIKRIIAPETDPKDEVVVRKDIIDPQRVEHEDENANNWVVSWRRTYKKEENEAGKLTLLIESKRLRAVLKDVIEGHVGVSFDTEQVELEPPYSIIFHHTHKLREYGQRNPRLPPETLEEIDILLHEVQNEPQQRTQRSDAQSLSVNGEITFDLLWTLYYPGQLVSAPVQVGGERHDHICLLTYCSTENSELSKTSVRLDMESIDYDGNQFRSIEHTVNIKSFKGPKAISELEVVPLPYYKNSKGERDQEGLKAVLRKRGKRFVEIVTAEMEGKHFNYKGAMVSEGRLEMVADTAEGESDIGLRLESSYGSDSTSWVSKAKTSVMVDHEAYFVSGNKKLRLGIFEAISDPCSCNACSFLRKRYIGKLQPGDRPVSELDHDQYLFCPPRVFGFDMKRKEWVQMLTENVENIESKGREDAFKKLELDEASKELLKDLVMQHDKKVGYVDDLVPGKGQSLVALLHGPPESLALLTAKPLYTLSMSDIGSTPSTVEQNLLRVFELTAHWKALLLFDEADIFLEKRSIGDLRRNGLVSVFIRLLEYYDGILFLTTNRVRTLDEAFQSRIQVALEYEDLSKEQCRQIWDNWLDKAGDDVRKEQIRRELGRNPDALKLNGRQIRNAFKSAVALAKSEGGPYQKLEWHHLEKVLKNTLRFKTYMQQTNRQAEKEGLRWE